MYADFRTTSQWLPLTILFAALMSFAFFMYWVKATQILDIWLWTILLPVGLICLALRSMRKQHLWLVAHYRTLLSCLVRSLDANKTRLRPYGNVDDLYQRAWEAFEQVPHRRKDVNHATQAALWREYEALLELMMAGQHKAQ